MSTGVKRDRDGNTRAKNAGQSTAPRGRFHDMFEGFRDELDEHHDRRERIIKASRDVTAQSKKIIFALQRVKYLHQDFPPNIQQDMDTRITEIAKLLNSIAPDLQTINRYRYTSPLRCLEELIEALSFAHYLRHQTLITLAQSQAAMPADIALTPHDYMYGVFDLFGELMRFATVTTAQTGELVGQGGRNILGDIQALSCAFEELPDVPTRDFRGKMVAMSQSVKKVEKLGYGLVVRGSERPKGWLPDMKDEAPEPVSPVDVPEQYIVFTCCLETILDVPTRFVQFSGTRSSKRHVKSIMAAVQVNPTSNRSHINSKKVQNINIMRLHLRLKVPSRRSLETVAPAYQKLLKTAHKLAALVPRFFRGVTIIKASIDRALNLLQELARLHSEINGALSASSGPNCSTTTQQMGLNSRRNGELAITASRRATAALLELQAVIASITGQVRELDWFATDVAKIEEQVKSAEGVSAERPVYIAPGHAMFPNEYAARMRRVTLMDRLHLLLECVCQSDMFVRDPAQVLPHTLVTTPSSALYQDMWDEVHFHQAMSRPFEEPLQWLLTKQMGKLLLDQVLSNGLAKNSIATEDSLLRYCGIQAISQHFQPFLRTPRHFRQLCENATTLVDIAIGLRRLLLDDSAAEYSFYQPRGLTDCTDGLRVQQLGERIQVRAIQGAQHSDAKRDVVRYAVLGGLHRKFKVECETKMETRAWVVVLRRPRVEVLGGRHELASGDFENFLDGFRDDTNLSLYTNKRNTNDLSKRICPD
ncbi:hypothetical protein G7046_g8165 [Stylonectria norvegica]|nr:hypothetical protein G7046_g8165 [Stylonectria norvegica]